MRRAARIATKFAGMAAVTLVTWPALLVGLTLLAGSKARSRRWRYACMRTWARGVTRAAGIRVETSGHPPRPPYLLVSNHLGYVDILVLSTAVDGSYVSRGDVRNWPLVGWLSRSVRVIFVDRSRRADIGRVATEVETRVAEGEGVIFFPEGTSTGGDRVLPFKTSIFDAAVRTGTPVHWAVIDYATSPPDPPADLSVCWWGDMTFVGHFLGLLGLKHGARATVRFGDTPIAGSDRKQLAQELHEAIEGTWARGR